MIEQTQIKDLNDSSYSLYSDIARSLEKNFSIKIRITNWKEKKKHFRCASNKSLSN